MENITIRTVRPDDARIIVQLHLEIASEREFLITVPEDFKRTEEEQRIWIQQLLANEREMAFVAEVEGVVVGWTMFSSSDRARLAHAGSIGIFIKKEYRDIGIGRRLIQAILDWATEHPVIEKVSLGVFATNIRAIALYKKLGFVEEGRKVREFKLSENEYVDDILMYKFV
ncbi:GNAT family N-acetyltransferase [Priestia taiwanensis]|uniref:N-acetyltransferase n=1 Tax=Priestia taiwanensis TaxID=1347902 RepID=A0A917AKI2_9BACI|nr:GNAT family protein [Priestia taiwanensis]MBM7362060.1 RimJ/RimL family protein N-acetyltransferase [Priestia taiwanensis]GGE59116.1 N-acetyltransferase [Priestia taiwanensis]